jgi:hypothetical protein
MKTHLSRFVSLASLLLIIPLLTSSTLPMGKKVNFSGTWILNETKSDFAEYGRMMASDKIIIVHKGKKLTMERYATAPTGEAYNYTENYTLDGKECVNAPSPEFKKTSTVAKSEDKKGLVINSTLEVSFEGNTMKILTVENYSLQEDGKVMAIKATASTDYGDMAVNFVYDLQ